jgi:Flagellar hook-length control protein FliK
VPDQVLRHLESVRALREGGHRTVLRLEPEHLGAVTLTVDVRAGAVRMAVAGGTQALAAVREGIERLRSSLADAGLDLGDVALRADTVSSASSSSSSSSFSSPSPGSGPGADGRGSTSGPDGGTDSSRSGDRHSGRRQDGAPDAAGAPEPAHATAQRRRSPAAEDLAGLRRLDVRV